mgnify:CR=1 FL=1
MKVTSSRLRRIIKEALNSPSYAETAVLNALRNMSGERGLPVTHEFPAAALDPIMKDRVIRGTYGIFFTIGHLRSPQFVTGPGYMIHGYIPLEHVSSSVIYPDMRFAIDQDDDEFEDAWEAMWAEQRGNLEGLEISTNYEEWPASQWQAIIDNQTGEPI